MGATGDSVRKCVAFFLAAAKEAGLEVSPYVTEAAPRQNGTPARKAAAPKAGNGAKESGKLAVQRQIAGDVHELSWKQMLLSKFPSFDPAWPDEVKREWFVSSNLMMKMEDKNQPEQVEDDDIEAEND